MRVGASRSGWGGITLTDANIQKIQNTASKTELNNSLWDYIKDWFTGSHTQKAKEALWDLTHSAISDPTKAIDAFMWLKEHAGASYQNAFNMREVIELIESPPNSVLYQTMARIELSIDAFKVKTGACRDFLGEKANYLEYIKESSGLTEKTAAECIKILKTDIDRVSFLIKIGNETYRYGPGENSPILHLVKKTQSMLDAEVSDVVQAAYEDCRKQSISDPQALTFAATKGEEYRRDYEEKWKKELRAAKAKVALDLTDRSNEQIINMAAICSQGVAIAMHNDKSEYQPLGNLADSNTLYKLTKFQGEANIITMSFTKKSLTHADRQMVKYISDLMNKEKESPIERKCNFEMRATFLITKAHTYCVKVSWIDNDAMTKTVAHERPLIYTQDT